MKKTEQEKKPQASARPDAAESNQPEQPPGAKAETAAKADAAAGAEQPGEKTPGKSPEEKSDGSAEKPPEDAAPQDETANPDSGQAAKPDAEPAEVAPDVSAAAPEQTPEQPAPEPETPSSGTPEPPAGDAAADELARLRAELLASRCLNAAYAAGVRPELTGDAATLAAAEAGPDGDAEKAVDAILKRHPEWKAGEEGGKRKAGRTTQQSWGEDPCRKAAGGFRLGADPDKTAAKPAGKLGETTGKKRWNRFK